MGLASQCHVGQAMLLRLVPRKNVQLLEEEATAKRSALRVWRRNLPLHPDPRQGSDHVHTRPRVSLIITQQAISGLTHKRHSRIWAFHTASHLPAKGNETWVKANKNKIKTAALGVFSKKLNKLGAFFWVLLCLFFWEINCRKKKQKTVVMVTHFQLKAEHFFLCEHTRETYKCPHKILLDQSEHFHNQLLG